MSCNCPMLAEKREKLPSGKYKYLPIGRYTPELKKAYPDAITVPCGKCAGCRADYTRQWADRMILELDHSGVGIFVTLTYDDEHLPVVYQTTTGVCEPTLSKRDCQLFMKRLRKEFKDRVIRFYLCGEYGSKGRPHYHAILYGLSLADFKDLQRKGCNPLGQEYFISKFFTEQIWQNGFCLLADVSWRTCAYVARYVRKKQFGASGNVFEHRLKEPVFSLMSRKPGIGAYYVEEHPECLDKAKIYLSDQNGSVEVWMPQSFLKFIEELDPVRYERLKKERMSAAENSLLAKLSQTDVFFDELCERQRLKMEDSGEYIDSLQVL